MGFKQQAQKHASSGGGGFKAKKRDEAGAEPNSTPKETPEAKPQADPLTAANLGLEQSETDIAIAKATSFRKWAKKMKLFIHPSIDIMVPVKGMGYGVVAIQQVGAGETIFSVPPGAYISPTDQDVPNCPACKLIDQHRPSLPDWSRSVLRLMAEKARGVKSPWAPWFDCAVVPDDHLFLTGDRKEEKGKEMLHSSSWGQSAVAQQVEDYDLEARYEQVKPFMALHPSVWPDGVTGFRCFKECAAFVASRNFHIEARQRPGPFLVPAVDFLNHSNKGQPHVKFILTGGREKGLTFEVRATQDLKPGKQVFHDYGDLSNARLLVEFGFRLNDYEKDAVRLSQNVFARMSTQATLLEQEKHKTPDAKLRTPSEVETDMKERVQFLSRLGILYEEGLFILKGAKGGQGLEFGEAEQTLVDVFFCLSRTPSEWNDLKSRLARWWHVEGKKLVGEASYFATIALGCLLQTYPSTLADSKGEEGGNYMDQSVRTVLATDRDKLQLAIGFLSAKAVAPSVDRSTKKEPASTAEKKTPEDWSASGVPLPQQKLQMVEKPSTEDHEEDEEEWETDDEGDDE